MKYSYIFILIFTLLISCKSVEKNTAQAVNINFNEGWVNENKFIATSIGYPNGYAATKEDMKTSAFNAALALSKVKIENAFIKELPNKRDDNRELRDVVEKYIKVEYSSFVDGRYYQLSSVSGYNASRNDFIIPSCTLITINTNDQNTQTMYSFEQIED